MDAKNSIDWLLEPLDALQPRQIFAMFRLRQEVFVLEQQCLYADLDDIDLCAQHLLGWRSDSLVAYLRIIPPLGKYPGPAIGRVLTARSVRGEGLGRALMQQGIARTEALFPEQAIFLAAQTYLVDFYGALGFCPYGEAYVEDGIEHIEMRRVAPGVIGST